jgi:hypothetical protein
MMSNGWAQAPDAKTGSKPGTESNIAEPKTREAVRELLFELDDKQVRELLLKRMSEQVNRRAAAIAAQNEVSFTDTTRSYARSLRTFFADVADKVTAIPHGFQVAWRNFTEQRDQRDFSWL